MEKLVDDGLVKHIGVANFPVILLHDMLSYARIPPAVNQVEIHPYNQQSQLLEYCRAHNIVVQAYSPLGSPGYKESVEPEVLSDPILKEIANKHGIIATFMAKISDKLPGCSGHIHQSLWNPDKTQNLFYDAGAQHNMSELFNQYLAGQLYCLPHIVPMLAPTVNSYKRLVEGAWAGSYGKPHSIRRFAFVSRDSRVVYGYEAV